MNKITFEKPNLFKPEASIGCHEYHIIEFVNAYKLPFHWLLADSWDFYYKSTGEFLSMSAKKFYNNLQDIYSIKITSLERYDIKDILNNSLKENICVFVRLDAYYLPWHSHCFKNRHASFLVLITDFDEINNRVYIRRGSTTEFYGWIDLQIIIQAYESNLKDLKAFVLTPPRYQLPNNFVLLRMKETLKNIRGELNEDYSSGLIGIQTFLNDLKEKQYDINLLKFWEKGISSIESSRHGFMEYLLFLEQYSMDFKPDSKLLFNVEKAFCAWTVLKNWTRIQIIQNKFNKEKMLEKIKKIYEIECEIADQIEHAVKDGAQ